MPAEEGSKSNKREKEKGKTASKPGWNKIKLTFLGYKTWKISEGENYVGYKCKFGRTHSERIMYIVQEHEAEGQHPGLRGHKITSPGS